ncbi:MAG: putative membrane protein SirB2 [Thermoproteota archaeon]|jgi:uncharacterized membrane protein SirB2
MPYEIYKIAHLTCIFIMMTGFAAGLLGNDNAKSTKIIGGIATLLVFVSGMGLIARIGISHGQGWPLWLQIKICIFILISVGAPIVLKRFKSLHKFFYWFMIALFAWAVYLVNYKPS